MSKGPNILRYLLACLVAIAAAAVYQYFVVLQRWRYVDDLPRSNFDVASNFTVKSIKDMKVTYYSSGKLGDVLKEWPHAAFHLFRLNEGETFHFDENILRSPNTAARKLDYTCAGSRETECNHESVLVPNCIFELNSTIGTETTIDAHQMLTDEGKGYHVSFANLTNRDTIQQMWNLLHLPFSLEQTVFEHAFISNLISNQMTASFHANPITDSMGVQLVGKKTWLFLPSDTYLRLMKSTFAGSALFPKQAPPLDSSPEVYVITTQPGDVLFFPESWGHAVYTYEGPNLLMNYRKVYPGNFLRQPLTWTISLIEHLINGQEFTNKQKSMQYVPTKKLNVKVSDIYANMCALGGRTAFDQQMLEIIHDEAQYHSK